MDLGIDGISSAEAIGSGASAQVYRAQQPALGRAVAVKVLRTTDPDLVRRFKREARALGRLSRHPRIVSLYQFGETEAGYPFLVLELCERSLLDRLREEGPLDWVDACRILGEVADGVAAAHAADIVHRDLKPANILTNRTGDHLITDFGISTVVGTTSGQTASVGFTAGYAAPETFQGARKAGKPADVYALGATLFHLLTGRVPFSSADGDPNLLALISRISTDPVPDIRSARVPDAVAELVERLLDKRPENRPSAAELHRELAVLADRDPAVTAAAAPAATTVGHDGANRGSGAEETTDTPPTDEAPAVGVGPMLMLIDDHRADTNGALVNGTGNRNGGAGNGSYPGGTKTGADTGSTEPDDPEPDDPDLDGPEPDDSGPDGINDERESADGARDRILEAGQTSAPPFQIDAPAETTWSGLIDAGPGRLVALAAAALVSLLVVMAGAGLLLRGGADGAGADTDGSEQEADGSGPDGSDGGGGSGDSPSRAGVDTDGQIGNNRFAGGLGSADDPTSDTGSDGDPNTAPGDGEPPAGPSVEPADGSSTTDGTDDTIDALSTSTSTGASTTSSTGPTTTRPTTTGTGPTIVTTGATTTIGPTTTDRLTTTTGPTTTRPSSSISATVTTATVPDDVKLSITGEGRVPCFAPAIYTASANRPVTDWAWTAPHPRVSPTPTTGSATVTVDFGVNPGFYDLTVSAGGGSVTRRIEVVSGPNCDAAFPVDIGGPTTVTCNTSHNYRLGSTPDHVQWASPDLTLPTERGLPTIRIRFDVPVGTYSLGVRVNNTSEETIMIRVVERADGSCTGA